ncbi:hypothetical protein [Hyphomonas sp.]|uniref:hypothetical protein n=1 Tax=Hyphomonas sp. TaxID=87 RepID=UPI000E0506F0|nr:hypothetical protein [Hyphomonas sp.]RCL89640.1 MAG: hypothetical protein DBW63_01635 [Hyphomonas sp.]
MIRIISIILAGAVLSGCAYLQDVYSSDGVYGSGADPYEKIQFAGEKATGAERAACESAGGRVARDGMRGWEQCIQPFEDAGKACADNADCIGQCRLSLGDDMPEAGKPVTGKCQATDSPFGCYATVENGRATPALCVD